MNLLNILPLLTIVLLIISAPLAAEPATRTIFDTRGREVTFPADLKRVATVDDGFVEGIMTHLGLIDKVAARRELGTELVDLSKSFADIDELLGQCRFNDCTHTTEPGCAVRAAIASEQLEERRFESYRKLLK